MKTKVIKIEYGKKPEVVEVKVPVEMQIIDGDVGIDHTNELYDGHALARRMLRDMDKDVEYIQYIVREPFNTLVIFIDEEGRLKRMKANRKIVSEGRGGIPYADALAGPIVVIPCIFDRGYAMILDYGANPLLDKRIDEQIEKFLKYNGTDGSDELHYLSQEESDNIGGPTVITGEDVIKKLFGLE